MKLESASKPHKSLHGEGNKSVDFRLFSVQTVLSGKERGIGLMSKPQGGGSDRREVLMCTRGSTLSWGNTKHSCRKTGGVSLEQHLFSFRKKRLD